MRTRTALLLVAVSATLIQCRSVPREPRLEFPMAEGVRIEADGRPIDVEVGHLVPCAIDWDSDGRKDLVVGQFSEGRIRLYLNRGTDVAPEFGSFDYLDAGGNEIHLPAG